MFVYYMLSSSFSWLWYKITYNAFEDLHFRILKTCCELLTHWGWVIHIYISKLTVIVSDNGFLPGQHQAIIWTNAGILLIRTFGTNFSEILSEIHIFSFKKMHLKILSAKWQQLCHDISVLKGNDFNPSIPLLSSPPSATYMRQWTRTALVQIMACCLIGAKPLSEPVLEYC